MAVSIVLSENLKAPIWNDETSIYFEDNGADYHYLYDMILEIKNNTGELIDLYDDAEFSNDDLLKLRNIVIKYSELAKKKTEKEWNVKVADQILPEKKEIFKTLIKKELIQKLEKFIFIIGLAIERNEKIICIGD